MYIYTWFIIYPSYIIKHHFFRNSKHSPKLLTLSSSTSNCLWAFGVNLFFSRKKKKLFQNTPPKTQPVGYSTPRFKNGLEALEENSTNLGHAHGIEVANRCLASAFKESCWWKVAASFCGPFPTLFRGFLYPFLPSKKWVYLHLVVRGREYSQIKKIRKLRSLQCATLVHVKSGRFKWRTACPKPRSDWFPFQSDQKRGPKR